MTLTAPADPARPDGPSISTPVLDIQIGVTAPGQPPVLLLTGGPGGKIHLEAAADIIPWIDLAKSLAPISGGGRRVILVAQRGTGLPLSSLVDCAELYAPEIRFGGDKMDPQVRSIVATCRSRALAAGLDPAIFSTANSVSDLISLRELLQLPNWIPFGFSYGTRLALELARVDPDGTAALILDSVDPPGDTPSEASATNLDAALHRLDRICQAQKDCAAAVPDIPMLAHQAASLIDAKPHRIKMLFGGAGKTASLKADGRDFLGALEKALRDPSTAEWIPRVVAEGARGHWKPLGTLMSIENATPPDESFLMETAVDCQDFDSIALADQKRASELSTPLYAGIRPPRKVFEAGICAAILGYTPKPAPRPPVHYDGPTLILSGDLDPVTPLDAAQRLAAALGANARLIVYPELGHVVTGEAACARIDVLHFLDGTLKDGISACDGQIPPLVFPLPR